MKTSENIATSIRKIRKRKFSEEQIRSLEFLFESEARPEAQLKQKVASELGLHPRQVAIWFQNKRARSKSKQIEQDYAVLKASYDNLALQFESLEKENQNLAIQLQRLRDGLEKPHGKEDEESEIGYTNLETKERYNPVLQGRIEYFAEDTHTPKMEEQTNSSLTSSADLGIFKSSCFQDQSNCSSQWWELWS
ncbi:Homeobox-leucine zipper protein ATHB-12 [Vitis vinifera]|uniref:Homeobox-leucine zipper protein n=1 Tax=Vitis vinifera TaxID=29760 RepID=A0A438I4S9_VITVI|nr:Homeobox-leucine zipper protein ATHB-12 [Vitis vinifera]